MGDARILNGAQILVSIFMGAEKLSFGKENAIPLECAAPTLLPPSQHSGDLSLTNHCRLYLHLLSVWLVFEGLVLSDWRDAVTVD